MRRATLFLGLSCCYSPAASVEAPSAPLTPSAPRAPAAPLAAHHRRCVDLPEFTRRLREAGGRADGRLELFPDADLDGSPESAVRLSCFGGVAFIPVTCTWAIYLSDGGCPRFVGAFEAGSQGAFLPDPRSGSAPRGLLAAFNCSVDPPLCWSSRTLVWNGGGYMRDDPSLDKSLDK